MSRGSGISLQLFIELDLSSHYDLSGEASLCKSVIESDPLFCKKVFLILIFQLNIMNHHCHYCVQVWKSFLSIKVAMSSLCAELGRAVAF